MQIEAYDLTDAELLKDDTPGSRYLIWQPPFLCIVLGQGSEPEKSVHADAVANDRIPLYRRPSGGEAVLLSPDTLAVSILSREDKLSAPGRYFNKYNETILQALTALGVRDLSHQGLSDIAIGDKKILGSAIYRSRGKVFYQAVLNVSLPPATIEQYLRQPTRQPPYRRHRPHRHFVTSLKHQGYNISLPTLRQTLAQNFAEKQKHLHPVAVSYHL